MRKHLVGDGCYVVDQAQLRLGEEAPLRLGMHWEGFKGPLSRMAPVLDEAIDFRSPEEIWLLW